MKNRQFRQVLFVRRAFQMTVVSVVLVMVISVAIVVATGSGANIGTSECGQVQNLTVEETDTELIITWDPAIDDGEIRLCGGFYYIDYIIGDVIQPPVAFHTATDYTITKGSCVDHSISIRSSDNTGAPGAALVIEYYSGIAGTGAVQGLRVEGLSAVWTQPENSQNCRLTYQVDIANELDKTSDITNALTFPLPNVHCVTNNAVVTAIVSGSDRTGRPVSLSHTIPEGSDAPIHHFTNPTTDGAEFGWRRSDVPNYCEISEIEFTIVDSTITTRMQFNPDEILTNGTFIELESDTDFWYTARWILKSGIQGTTSDPVRFQTVPLSSPIELNTTQLDDGGLNITWRQLYNSEFVTKHVTTVKSLGPNHLVPEECPPSDAGEVYVYISEPEETTFFFEQSRPHQYYEITVTTHFGDLGMQTSNTSLLLTPTDVPGEVTVVQDQDYEPGVPYNVTTFLYWSIPCDINGPFERFDYKITGRLAGEIDAEYCEIQFDSGEKFIDEHNTTQFDIETQMVNPFFHTTLVVYTILQDGTNSSTTIPITAVPPYTPPDSPAVP